MPPKKSVDGVTAKNKATPKGKAASKATAVTKTKVTPKAKATPKTKAPPKPKFTSPKRKSKVNEKDCAKPKGKKETLQVESILEHKNDGRGLRFLVRWAGYPNKENQWVTMSKMGCDALISEYFDRICEKREKKRAEKLSKGKAETPMAPEPTASTSALVPKAEGGETSPTRKTPKRKAAPLFECELLDPVPKKQKKSNVTPAVRSRPPGPPSSRPSTSKANQVNGDEANLAMKKENPAPVRVKQEEEASGARVHVKEEEDASASRILPKQERAASPPMEQGSSKDPSPACSGDSMLAVVQVKKEIPEVPENNEVAQQLNRSESEGGSVEQLQLNLPINEDQGDADAAELVRIKKEMPDVVAETPSKTLRIAPVETPAKPVLIEVHPVQRESLADLKLKLATVQADIAGVNARQTERDEMYRGLQEAEAGDRQITAGAMETLRDLQEKIDNYEAH